MSEGEKKIEKRLVSWDDIEKSIDEYEPQFLKFEEGKQYVLRFLRDEPRESHFINPEGKESVGYEFWVEYEGRPRIISVTSIRFLDTLRELRKITGTLEGAEILVVKKGHGMNTNYVVALLAFPKKGNEESQNESESEGAESPPSGHKKNPPGWHKIDVYSRIPVYQEAVDWILSKSRVLKDEFKSWLQENGFNESTAERMAYAYFAYLDKKSKGIRGKTEKGEVFIPITDIIVNGEGGKV